MRHEETYKGFKIVILDTTARERVPALISGKKDAMLGAGIGTDKNSAIVKAKAKIDNFSTSELKLVMK